MAKLNAKQSAFVDEYCKDRNATQAAIRAGYSAKTAESQGSRLLGNVNISEEIALRISDSYREAKVDRASVIKELSKGAFAELDVADMKYSDKIKCLELLAKSLGMLDGSAGQGNDKSSAVARINAAIKNFGRGRPGSEE